MKIVRTGIGDVGRSVGVAAVVCAAVVLLACVGVAGAASPWWRLSSLAAPTWLHAGRAQDEVQEVTVSATSGEMVLFEPRAFQRQEFFNSKGEPEFALLPFDASAEVVQGALAGIYGVGNVEVAGGPGDEEGTKPYVIKFVGGLADQGIIPIYAGVSNLLLGCEGAKGAGCKQEASVREATVGRPDGVLIVSATNQGDASVDGSPVPVTVKDTLPAGMSAVSIKGQAGGDPGTAYEGGPVSCSLASVSCTYAGVLPSYEEIKLYIAVKMEPSVQSGALNEVSVSGGNAAPVSVTRPVTVKEGATPYGVQSYEMFPEEEGGGMATQAGSHPFQLTSVLNLNFNGEGNRGAVTGSPALTKDLYFKIPPGLIGNPTPFPQCTLPRFLHGVNGVDQCPNNTAIGVASTTINLQENEFTFTTPVFNLTPSVGEPARFGFLAGAPVILDTAVRTGGDYGVTVSVKNITQVVQFLGSRVTLWGVPGDPRHDSSRGWSCIDNELFQMVTPGQVTPCKPLAQRFPPPFLELPTACAGPMQTSIETDSWAKEGMFTGSPATTPPPALDGCNALPFTPSLSVAPDGEAASTATGLTVGIHVPQEVSLDAEGLSETDVRNTTVALPQGVALNPAAADGLLSCSLGQIALESHTTPTCPDAAKVGNVEIETPLLPNKLTGAAYLAAQEANPFGSLVALYVVAQDPVSGTLIKVAGEVKLDQQTGQIVSYFPNTPPLPFENFRIHFYGGARAPLGSPQQCGAYTTTSAIEGWSGNAPSTPSSTFHIITGANGARCQNPLPFVPELHAGTTSIQAGGFSPFTMTMGREDGEQNLQGIQLKMPLGMSGTLSTVKLCDETDANAGTCGSESLIGETIVSVGLGGDPFSVKGGKVYITGPYKGAPFGLSIVNPAKAGPFDLGKVVVRAKIDVNEETAALTITTDNEGPYKIPTIIDGIPLEIKHVFVNINRPNFTFNATNCEPLKITGSLTSTEGAVSALSVPYQVTNCAVLAFKPKLEASTAGNWTRTGGTSLNVKLSYPAGPYDANITRVKVELPKGLPSRLPTLQKACLASVFETNPAGCPAASVIGHARATTPVLPVPLEGPAYFVSHGGEAFPSLIIVLQGYGVTVHLVGTTFISKAGITSSTFKTVPDVPVGTFELNLPAGPYSALTGLGNLCKSKSLAMPTEFVGQNGALIDTTTRIAVTGCPKAKKVKYRRKSVAHKHATKHGRGSRKR